MSTRYSLISEITLPLGSVCLDGPYGGSEIWIDVLVAMPRLYVLRHSVRQTLERTGMGFSMDVGTWLKPTLSAKHRRISFTYTTMYSPWPVGQEYDHARDFCDLFLSRFFQWPAGMHSNRSDVFKSSFASISEQAEITISALQGILLCPPMLPRIKSSDNSK